MKIEELISELNRNKDNSDIATSKLKEINIKLKNKEVEFTSNNTEELYTYMLLSNKLGIKDTLDELINTPEFIKLIDDTNIDGSVLPSLTNICTKPRTCLLKNSQKLKNSIIKGDNILSPEDILSDLTEEEIRILREDFEIDNYLINKGISFRTLKPETINRLLSDANIFDLYNIYTINEFANSYVNKEDLINNEIFFDIYINKLTDEYNYTNDIFKLLDTNKVKSIIDKYPANHILLHLVKDTKKDVQEYLLKNKELLNSLYDITDEHILSKLPKDLLIRILSKRPKLLSGSNLKVLETLNKKDLSRLLKQNKDLYQELIDSLLKQTKTNLNFLINALSPEQIKDLCDNHLINLDLKTLNNLLETQNEELRKAILKNAELSTKIINKATTKSFDLLEDIISSAQYTGEEVVKILNNMTSVNDTKVLNKLIETVPLSLRKNIYNNNVIRKEILKEETYILDDYSIKHLIKNPEELKQQTAKVILTILNNADVKFIAAMLDEEIILEKIFSDTDSINSLIDILSSKKYLLQLLNNKKIINYYNRENIQELLKRLNINDKINLCTNELIKKLVDDNGTKLDLYKKLYNTNKYILETLNFDFLCIPNLEGIKISSLEEITKYPQLQEDILVINKHFTIVPDFLNSLIYNTSDLDFAHTIGACLSILRASAEGINRKTIGNIPKLINNYNNTELTKSELKSLISYLLYLIPRYYSEDEKLARPIIIDTPNTFEDILVYEKDTENEFTRLIQTGTPEEVRKYFVAKHFKLTPKETSIMLNSYSIERIDRKIYHREYEILNNLRKIMNTDSESLKEMDSKYEIISMYDSFVLEKQIKEMYGKIYNFEIRSKTYSNKPFTKTIYGKEIQIFSCPNDFLFLVSNMDIDEELILTNSYFEAWHNSLNKSPNGLRTSLISNDNFTINDDLIFGFNGVLDEGINKISKNKLFLNSLDNQKTSYMTPRELIDNTRDETNSIVIDRYAIRPNYNNSNIPNIEPDFILVDLNKLNDNQYLEKISRASEEFKTKRNKNGLPIIAYDIEKISSNELSKIKSLLNKYLKTYDMTLLYSILTKLENNYTAYRNTNPEIAQKFAITDLLNILKERINITNSIAELDYIEELFTRESKKFKDLSNELSCNYSIKELKELINSRKDILNS